MIVRESNQSNTSIRRNVGNRYTDMSVLAIFTSLVCCLTAPTVECLTGGILWNRSRFVGRHLMSHTIASKNNMPSSRSDSRSGQWTMKLRVGILGLPNVGKSTLFNALARQSLAQAANFPFCTIDPNICQVPILDPYLHQVASVGKSERQVHATMEWVDVAGLAKSAHRGEGLGNQFLATLRDCSCLCHVVRAFEDPQVVHVDGVVDPIQDIESIQLELILADQAHVQRRLERTNVAHEERDVLESIALGLQDGIPARKLSLSEAEKFTIKSMGLLTLKPVIYAWNVDEVDLLLDRENAEARAREALSNVDQFDETIDLWALVSAKVESELALSSNNKEKFVEYLETVFGEQLEEEYVKKTEDLLCYSVLPKLVKELLGYSIVFTGPGVPPERSKTTRAHLIPSQRKSSSSSDEEDQMAPFTVDDLAGRIHGEIQKGFLRAEVIKASDLVQYDSFVAAKESGKVRSEGKEYAPRDHEVLLIKWKGG